MRSLFTTCRFGSKPSGLHFNRGQSGTQRSGALGTGRQQQRSRIAQEIARFLRNPRKPAILAMSRPDAKKNITTLVNAFGKNTMLRELANLVLIMVRAEGLRSSWLPAAMA